MSEKSNNGDEKPKTEEVSVAQQQMTDVNAFFFSDDEDAEFKESPQFKQQETLQSQNNNQGNNLSGLENLAATNRALGEDNQGVTKNGTDSIRKASSSSYLKGSGADKELILVGDKKDDQSVQKSNAERTNVAVSKQRDKKGEDKYAIPKIYEYDIDANPKPWLQNNKADMDQYFNYGFTEETWKYHVQDVLSRQEYNPQRLNKIQEINFAQKNHPQLKCLLPAEYGGLNDPEDSEWTNRLRLFTEDDDLPQIKPKTVNQRNEFYIELIDKLPEQVSMLQKTSPNPETFKKWIVDEWEQTDKIDLQQQKEEKEMILRQKVDELNELRRKRTQKRRDDDRKRRGGGNDGGRRGDNRNRSPGRSNDRWSGNQNNRNKGYQSNDRRGGEQDKYNSKRRGNTNRSQDSRDDSSPHRGSRSNNKDNHRNQQRTSETSRDDRGGRNNDQRRDNNKNKHHQDSGNQQQKQQRGDRSDNYDSSNNRRYRDDPSQRQLSRSRDRDQQQPQQQQQNRGGQDQQQRNRGGGNRDKNNNQRDNKQRQGGQGGHGDKQNQQNSGSKIDQAKGYETKLEQPKLSTHSSGAPIINQMDKYSSPQKRTDHNGGSGSYGNNKQQHHGGNSGGGHHHQNKRGGGNDNQNEYKTSGGLRIEKHKRN